MTTVRRLAAIVLPLTSAIVGVGASAAAASVPTAAIAPATAGVPAAVTAARVATAASAASAAAINRVATAASAAGAAAINRVATAASAGSAAAIDGKITSPADGAKVSSGRVQVSASLSWLCQAKLVVDGEGISGTTVAEGGNCLGDTSISGSFSPPESAANGSYKVTLKGSVTQTVFDSLSFVVSRPPASPSGVSAKLDGASKVLVTWAKGEEPDLQAYEISATQGGASGSVTVGQACSGSECQAQLKVPAKAAGHKVGYSVKAVRSDGAGGTVTSSSSSPAYVSVPAPKASPKASPGPGKSVRDLPQLPSGPTSRATQHVSLPNTLPTKAPKLPDPGKTDFTLPEATQAPTAAAPPEVAPAQIAADAAASSNRLNIWLYIAVGLLLLLVGAHIGAWIRRRTAPASGAMSGRTVTGPGTKSSAAAVRRPTVILAVAKPRSTLEGTDAQTVVGSAAGEPTPISVADPADPGLLALPPADGNAVVVDGLPLAPAGPEEVAPVVLSGLDAPLEAGRAVSEPSWDSYLPPQPRSLEDSGFWKASSATQDPPLGDPEFAEDDAALYLGHRRRDD